MSNDKWVGIIPEAYYQSFTSNSLTKISQRRGPVADFDDRPCSSLHRD